MQIAATEGGAGDFEDGVGRVLEFGVGPIFDFDLRGEGVSEDIDGQDAEVWWMDCGEGRTWKSPFRTTARIVSGAMLEVLICGVSIDQVCTSIFIWEEYVRGRRPQSCLHLLRASEVVVCPAHRHGTAVLCLGRGNSTARAAFAGSEYGIQPCGGHAQPFWREELPNSMLMSDASTV